MQNLWVVVRSCAVRVGVLVLGGGVDVDDAIAGPG